MFYVISVLDARFGNETNLKTVNAPIPLVNISNTCYLNTSLQILFMMNQVFNFGHWISKDANYSHAVVSDLSRYLALQIVVLVNPSQYWQRAFAGLFVCFE